MILSDKYQTIPKRYILCLLAFLGFANALIVRSNLSIAILKMVQPRNDTINTTSTGFDWSSQTQNEIISAFFYSYTICQIPAGFLVTVFGGKYLFGGGIGFAGFLTLLTPICAHMGSTMLFCLRFLEGISTSVMMTGSHSMWSKWAPKGEKTRLLTFVKSGYPFGIFVTMVLGGPIASYWSWEWIFYLSGASSIIWAIVWFCCVTESPSTHSTITPEELTYIRSNIHEPVIRNYSIPLTRILTSLPVWAVIVAHFGDSWISNTMLTELPLFLNSCLGYSVAKTGTYSSIAWLLLCITICAAGVLSDKLTEQYPTTYIRKLLLALAFIISSAAFLIIVLLSANHYTLILISIIIGLGGSGLSTSSYYVNHIDIGAQYAGFLMGLSNFFASMSGFAVPLLTARFVTHLNSKVEWNIIFIIPIFVALFAVFFYSFFAAGEVQAWVADNPGELQPVLNKPASSNGTSIDDLTDRIRAEINNENKNTE